MQLTPAAAARLLGVSRQFLIGQLKEREIPFHRVGAHYRFYLKDVLAYQMQRDNQWRRVPDALPLAEAVEDSDDRELPDDLKLAPLLDPDPPLQETPVSLPPVLADLSAAGVGEVLDDSISGAPGALDPCALESGASVTDAPDSDVGVSGVSVERPVDLKPERQLELPTPTQPAPTSVQLAPPSQSGQAPEPVPAASAESVSSSSLAAEELEARRLVTELLREPVDARTMARLEAAAQLDPRGEINSVKPGTLLRRLKTASKRRVYVNGVDELVRWIIAQNWT